MISLLNAAYLLGALGIAVPVVLHLLRRRPTQVVAFPSFLFVQATAARQHNRNTIRKWLVLLMRCLVLLLLAMAFSWPYLPKFKTAPEQVTVLLWDSSLSMQAQPYRDELRRRALATLRDAGEGRPAAVGVVADRTLWSGDFTEDAGQLERWFEQQAQGHGTSRFERALRLADRKLASAAGDKKRIVLVTDRQLLAWQDVKLSEPLSPGIALEVITPEEPGFRNAAIVDAGVNAPFVAADQPLPLRVELRNFNRERLAGRLQVVWQGQTVEDRPVELGGMSKSAVTVTLPGRDLAMHAGEVRLVVEDDLESDNTRFFTVNPAEPPTVHMTPSRRNQTDFVHTALAPNPKQPAATIKPLTDAATDEALAAAGVMIVRDNMRPGTSMANQVAQALLEGGSVIALWRDTPTYRQWLAGYGITAAAAPAQGTRRLSVIDFDHPVFEPFLQVKTAGLFDVLFFDPPRLDVPASARVLARFDNGDVAVAELPVDRGRLLLFAADMTRAATDWPVRASFLPLWRQLLLHLQRDGTRPASVAVSQQPLRYTQAQRLGLDGQRTDLPDRPGMTGPTDVFVPDTPGAYVVEDAGAQWAIAVNPPAEESDPLLLAQAYPVERLVSADQAPATAAAAFVNPEESRSFWWVLLVVAMVLLVLENLLANRTTL